MTPRNAAEMPSPGALPAVLVGLDCVTGLQTARILAKGGVRVVGIASNPRHFACRTRACSNVIVAEPDALISHLEELGPTFDSGAVLVPCTDAAVRRISRERSRLEAWYRIGLPDNHIVETLMDKVGFAEFATDHGFSIPATRVLHDLAQAKDAAESLQFPCVVKPAMKTPRWAEFTKAKAITVSDPAQLPEIYEQSAPFSDSLIVQEWIHGDEGGLLSCNAYFDSSSVPLGTFMARKIRQWPPETGTSASGEECRDDEMLHETVRLFQLAGFSGLAYLEAKRDRRTGKLLIVEANVGRPTGRSSIAEGGDVELVMTMYRDLAGITGPPCRPQSYQGVKWIYLRHELQAAFVAWRDRRITLTQWWSSIQGPKVYAVFSPTDPIPFLLDFWQTARRFLAGRIKPD